MHQTKKLMFFLGIFSLLLLGACNSSTEEKIYDHLEKAVDYETQIDEEENSITALEEKEQELYGKITQLSTEEFDEINQLAKKATENIDERSELIEIEKENFDESKDEFVKIEDLIEKLDGDKSKKKAKEMYSTMIDRYKVYNKLHDSYLIVLDNEKELYNNLQDEDVEQDVVTDRLDELNDSYEAVIKANDSFNNKTKEYNKLKKEFYKQSELNIEFDEADENNN